MPAGMEYRIGFCSPVVTNNLGFVRSGVIRFADEQIELAGPRLKTPDNTTSCCADSCLTFVTDVCCCGCGAPLSAILIVLILYPLYWIYGTEQRTIPIRVDDPNGVKVSKRTVRFSACSEEQTSPASVCIQVETNQVAQEIAELLRAVTSA